LMILTSMGIFGYLSKAHLDQAVPTGDVAAKIELIDEKIKVEKETIDAARKTIIQLDAQVDQTMSRTAGQTDDNGIKRSLAIRKNQSKERATIFQDIQKAQGKIATLNEERIPIASNLRKVEAEVGPIKYIAALIYGDNLDQSLLEKAVRIVILMIVFVFDPLAVLMLVAANWSLKHKIKKNEELDTEGWVWEEPEEPITESEQDPIPTPPTPSSTIEEDVNQLQQSQVTIKEIHYDSLGRRMTP